MTNYNIKLKKVCTELDPLDCGNTHGIRYKLAKSGDRDSYGGLQECRVYTDYPEAGGVLKRIVSPAEQTFQKEAVFNNTVTPRDLQVLKALK